MSELNGDFSQGIDFGNLGASFGLGVGTNGLANGVSAGVSAGVAESIEDFKKEEEKKKSNIDWGGTLSKGLDLGLAIFGKKSKPTTTPTKPKDDEPSSKILGMSKPLFYGGIGILALITTVIIVKKVNN